MNRRNILLILLCTYCVFSIPDRVIATDLPRIMIFGEDEDRNTIKRNSPVFKDVLEFFSNEFINEGFDVKDEPALTHKTHIQGKKRRSDAELIQIGKDVGMDVICMFSIYPNVKSHNNNSKKVTATMKARILEISSGSKLDSYNEGTSHYELIERPYSRYDLEKAVGKIAKVLARDAASSLAKKLSNYVDQKGGQLIEWSLTFEAFTFDDIMRIEEYIAEFPGYDSHRIKKNAINTSSHHEYLYRSSIDSAKLKKNLFIMFTNKLNMERPQFFFNGDNNIRMVKVRKVKQRRKSQVNDW